MKNKTNFLNKTILLIIICATAMLMNACALEHAIKADHVQTHVTDNFPGQKTEWFGYDRYDFEYDGRHCIVVTPKTAAKGRPWIWRARFFGHEPQTDLALLEKGFHLVYMDVANMFGCPTAVHHWNAFYDYLVNNYDFNAHAALEGMSRGGLIVYNWAAANPEKVACIYADNPVCDFKSWPAGKGKGKYHPPSWQACLKAYGLTEEQALTYKHNPIDNLEPLAKAGVPILHVCGTADSVVPVAENTDIVEKRYTQLGGKIEVIRKPGADHHPHSLKDPTPIVEFILKAVEIEKKIESVTEKDNKTNGYIL